MSDVFSCVLPATAHDMEPYLPLAYCTDHPTPVTMIHGEVGFIFAGHIGPATSWIYFRGSEVGKRGAAEERLMYDFFGAGVCFPFPFGLFHMGGKTGGGGCLLGNYFLACEISTKHVLRPEGGGAHKGQSLMYLDYHHLGTY